jgi:hypothetical protein
VTPPVSYVDAAAVRVAPGDAITAYIKGIGFPGYPRNLVWGEEGTILQKSGRTTGRTRGRLTVILADVALRMEPPMAEFAPQFVHYRDQMLVRGNGAVVEPGDSGALVLDMDRHPVGLLVGGREDGSEMVVTKIDAVLAALNHPRESLGTLDRRFVVATHDA